MRLERQQGVGLRDDQYRVRARHHQVPDPDRQPSAAHRRGRTGLQRDRSRGERLLPVRQRARRHLRAQDKVHLPRRCLRPLQDRVSGPPAGAAGQRLCDLQRARHSDPPGRGEVPELGEDP